MVGRLSLSITCDHEPKGLSVRCTVTFIIAGYAKMHFYARRHQYLDGYYHLSTSIILQ